MITDIDNIPLNSTYFTKNIENIDNNKWINYRDWKTRNEICMCWQITLPETWKEVFNIRSIDDIIKRLIKVNNNIKYVDGHDKSGWSTDQLDLYKYVMKWHKSTNNYVCLQDINTGFRRFGRPRAELNQETKKLIKSGFYSDCHCYRPYLKYKSMSDEIINLL